MTDKPHSEHRNLPPRMYFENGNFRYWDRRKGANKRLSLGADYEVALAKYQLLELSADTSRIRTFGECCVRYIAALAAPDFPFPVAPRTFKDRQRMLSPNSKLVQVFGQAHLDSLRPPDFAQYRDRRGSATSFNRERATVNRMFEWAIEQGYMTDNPLAKIRRNKETPRKRYVTDAEFSAVLTLANRPTQTAMSLSLLTGLRLSDVLRLRYRDVVEGYLTSGEGKIQSRVRFELTPEIEIVIEESRYVVIPANHRLQREQQRIRQAVGPDHHIIRKRQRLAGYIGEDGTPHGFKSTWQRLQRRALADGVITDRFTFHDIRAKHATDRDEGELQASIALGHADAGMTRRYLRHPLGRIVKPLASMPPREETD